MKKQSIPLIRNWISFQDKFKEIIDKRKKGEYKKISRIKDKRYIEILKTLDDEVINQYPYVIEKLKIQLKIFKQRYDIFSKPSLDIYQELINDIEHISKISNEENKIWTHRLRTWESLYDYKDKEIKKLPEPNFRSVKLGVFGDLINFFILKQQLYPLGGATIAGLSVEGSKKAKKETLKLLNKYLLYHYTGIKAIKKNIEINNEFKKIKEKYKKIWNIIDLSKVRNNLEGD